ncbi:MAG: hypothetical protein JKX79_11140 [Labilibaculum sp.]|nr:hypothetical protein [Labilibaculum sp.]
MKKIELISCIGIILSILLKILNLPFGGELLTVSITILATYYFLIFSGSKQVFVLKLRKFLFKEDVNDSIEIKISGFALPVVLIATLFRLQHFPFYSTLFYVGLTAILIALGITGYKYMRTKSTFLYNLAVRLIIIGGIGALIFITPSMENNNIDKSDQTVIESQNSKE